MKHKNIIKIYGYFSDEKNIFFIQEWAEEGDLWSIMRKQMFRCFQESKVASIIKQVLEAIEYMHSMHIIH